MQAPPPAAAASRPLARMLAESAVHVRDAARCIGRAIVKLERPRSAMIVAKAADPPFVLFVRQLALHLLDMPVHCAPALSANAACDFTPNKPQNPSGLSVYIEHRIAIHPLFEHSRLVATRPDLALRLRTFTPAHFTPTDDNAIDFIITLGGDGTVLFAAWLFQQSQVPPIIPFHLGSLGFLTVFHISDIRGVLARAVGCAGEGVRVNMRMRLACSVFQPSDRDSNTSVEQDTHPHEHVDDRSGGDGLAAGTSSSRSSIVSPPPLAPGTSNQTSTSTASTVQTTSSSLSSSSPSSISTVEPRVASIPSPQASLPLPDGHRLRPVEPIASSHSYHNSLTQPQPSPANISAVADMVSSMSLENDRVAHGVASVAHADTATRHGADLSKAAHKLTGHGRSARHHYRQKPPPAPPTATLKSGAIPSSTSAVKHTGKPTRPSSRVLARRLNSDTELYHLRDHGGVLPLTDDTDNDDDYDDVDVEEQGVMSDEMDLRHSNQRCTCHSMELGATASSSMSSSSSSSGSCPTHGKLDGKSKPSRGWRGAAKARHMPHVYGSTGVGLRKMAKQTVVRKKSQYDGYGMAGASGVTTTTTPAAIAIADSHVSHATLAVSPVSSAWSSSVVATTVSAEDGVTEAHLSQTPHQAGPLARDESEIPAGKPHGRRRTTNTDVISDFDDDAQGGIERETFHILNDLVVDRGPSPYMSQLELYVDDKHLTTVQADGLVVSTPTGSTAYSLSAGGSLVHPEVPSFLLTPICAHTLSFRPMLLPDTIELKIQVPRDSRNTAWASFDGRRRIELRQGDWIRVTMSRWPMPSVCMEDQSSDWFESLRRCLHWNERARQKPFSVPREVTAAYELGAMLGLGVGASTTKNVPADVAAAPVIPTAAIDCHTAPDLGNESKHTSGMRRDQHTNVPASSHRTPVVTLEEMASRLFGNMM